MTLREIAEEAGVSVSTVSRVINQPNTKAARPELQARIWEIVRRTDYCPNNAARSLKLGQTNVASETTSKSVACIYARTHTDSSDPFFSQIARAIEHEAFKMHCYVRCTYTSQDIIDAESMEQLSADGVIILGRYNQKLMNVIDRHCKNIIYTGLTPMDFQCDQVICDSHDIVYAAISYLQSLGHTHIGYVGEQDNESRFKAYKAALNALSLPFSQGNTANVHQNIDGGYLGIQKLMYSCGNLSAILCANDQTAIGAIRCLKENGYRVPKDISIISIDDIDIAQHIQPMLTTVHIPTDELGKITFKTLYDRIQGGHRLPLKISLPYYIAKRESCAPINKEHRKLSHSTKDVSRPPIQKR